MGPGEYLPSQYLPVLIYVAIAVLFGAVTITIGTVVRPRHPYREKLRPYESGMEPFGDARMPFPMRYYIIAMLFVIFDIEAVFLYPWAVVFNQIGFVGLMEMFFFIAVLLVGYVYAWKKGALEWE